MLKRGGWRSDSAFRKTYYLPIANESTPLISDHSIENNFHDYIGGRQSDKL